MGNPELSAADMLSLSGTQKCAALHRSINGGGRCRAGAFGLCFGRSHSRRTVCPFVALLEVCRITGESGVEEIRQLSKQLVAVHDFFELERSLGVQIIYRDPGPVADQL